MHPDTYSDAHMRMLVHASVQVRLDPAVASLPSPGGDRGPFAHGHMLRPCFAASGM